MFLGYILYNFVHQITVFDGHNVQTRDQSKNEDPMQAESKKNYKRSEEGTAQTKECTKTSDLQRGFQTFNYRKQTQISGTFAM